MTSKSGDLDDLSPFKKDLNQPKSAANDAAVLEEEIDLVGVSVGGNVEIFGDLPEEEIPNASSHEVCQKPMSMKAVENL
jgi:hypothetical protein